MMIFDSSFGIDFRQNHLILTYLRKSFGKIRLVDYGIHSILPEAQKEEREAQFISLINTFISKHQINKERVSISIPREKVVIRFIKFPSATKENLRKVVEYETSKYTPFEKGETCFDYQILKEENDWLHLFAVFVKKAEIDRYLSLLKKIGILPVSIQIPSTAALNLFLYNEEAKEEGVVLLDVTEPFFEMNFLQERGLIESFHLPLPPEEKASKIMTVFRRVGPRDTSFQKPTFFIYGLSADERTSASLKEIDQIKGVSFPSLRRVETGKGILKPHQIYASLGIPLGGLTKTRMEINLLPFEMRKKVKQIGKPLFFILTFLALSLSLTWGTGEFISYRKELNAITTEIKKRRPEVEAIEKLQKRKEGLEKEISELEKIKSSEASKIEILKELTQILPETVWVWNLKYSGREIEISGFADSASDLIPLIDKSPLFEKVEFLSPVTKERIARGPGLDKDKERFKIKARIEARRAGP